MKRDYVYSSYVFTTIGLNHINCKETHTHCIKVRIDIQPNGSHSLHSNCTSVRNASGESIVPSAQHSTFLCGVPGMSYVAHGRHVLHQCSKGSHRRKYIFCCLITPDVTFWFIPLPKADALNNKGTK